MLTGAPSGCALLRNFGGVEDAFDRARDHPDRCHEARQIEWNEDKRSQVPALRVTQQETKFEHGQQPFDDPFVLDCSRAARLPISRLDSHDTGASVPFDTPGANQRGRGPSAEMDAVGAAAVSVLETAGDVVKFERVNTFALLIGPARQVILS